MRYSRQNKIVELIGSYDIETQEMLSDLLRESGFEVTQATISRDIKDMKLVKSLTPEGVYKYVAADGALRATSERYIKIFRETIQTVAYSGNMLVIKTLSGCANAACEAIDSLGFEHVLGTVAGDNTLFLVVDDEEHTPGLAARFESLLA
ncbi:MAG: arginine repressor [Clostridiales Family XIII bacterium]|jgi:transcriptional regulator of arginine metabolism|nr:arginine repressor [Clostridiales Family XIII bacterium]